ncbi:MAG: DUF3108 domain-containing protein [Bacteroidota bacterium]|nr:DUF3108 domain-containing protein [Bacteroidota bacterium]
MAGSPLLQNAATETTTQIAPDSVYRTWTNDAWTNGEFLKYRVHYGVVNAGEIEMQVENDLKPIGKRKAYHIHARGKSYSKFDWFFKVRDHYQTYIDVEACQPLQFSKIMEEGSYKDSDFALFDYSKKRVSSAKKGSVNFTGDIQDVISAIYYARTLNVKDAKEGDLFPLQVYLDGEVHDLKIKFVKREVLDTDLGKVNAVKVIPMVVADRVFKDQEGLELWVSDDENKVPLRVKAGLLVGSVKVDIMSYNNLKYPLNMAK